MLYWLNGSPNCHRSTAELVRLCRISAKSRAQGSRSSSRISWRNAACFFSRGKIIEIEHFPIAYGKLVVEGISIVGLRTEMMQPMNIHDWQLHFLEQHWMKLATFQTKDWHLHSYHYVPPLKYGNVCSKESTIHYPLRHPGCPTSLANPHRRRSSSAIPRGSDTNLSRKKHGSKKHHLG